ncbi:MAG TPA: preprotein translocase subunit SecE [Acidimicrobiia bacterium]|nr:preprotein translocase subunit SecE [Acidimicrobiia bacterium]
MNREMRRLQEAEERRAKKRGRAPQKRRARQASGERVPLWKRLWTFLGEVRIELKRVSWPSRTQMVAFTTVTLITTTAVTLYIFGLDFGFGEAILWLLKRGT